MPRTIIIPREIEDRLTDLTLLKEESNGVLLYRRKGDECPVEYMQMTGIGDEGHVQSDPRRIKMLNKFFQQNPDYRVIKFHTHTVGTIKKHGRKYARQFSGGDIDGIREYLKHDREFIAMLVTPETTLLSGWDNPQLRIVDRSEDYERNHHIIESSLNQISADLGIELERFRGTGFKLR